MVACALATLVFGFFATRVALNASFDKMIPIEHPHFQNYLQNRSELRGVGNTLRVVVENRNGNIFDARYLDALKRINDDLFLAGHRPRVGQVDLDAPRRPGRK